MEATSNARRSGNRSWCVGALTVVIYAIAFCPALAQTGPRAAMISSWFNDAVYTVDLAEYADGKLVRTQELHRTWASSGTFSGIAIGFLDGNDFNDVLLIAHAADDTRDELQWFELKDEGLVFRGDLLHYDTTETRLVAVAAGALEAGSEGHVLTLELSAGDIGPRLWHYVFSGGTFVDRTELLVPLQTGRTLVGIACGDWDDARSDDVITIEHEDVDGAESLTVVSHYTYNAGTLTFESTLLSAERWLHNFVDVALADLDGNDLADLAVVDSFFHDAFTTIQHWESAPTSLQLEGFPLIAAPVGERLLGSAMLARRTSIPAVSEYGIVVMTLLILAGGMQVVMRRRAVLCP